MHLSPTLTFLTGNDKTNPKKPPFKVFAWLTVWHILFSSDTIVFLEQSQHFFWEYLTEVVMFAHKSNAHQHQWKAFHCRMFSEQVPTALEHEKQPEIWNWQNRSERVKKKKKKTKIKDLGRCIEEENSKFSLPWHWHFLGVWAAVGSCPLLPLCKADWALRPFWTSHQSLLRWGSTLCSFGLWLEYASSRRETSDWLLESKKCISIKCITHPTRKYLRKQNKSVKGLDCVNFDNVNLFINAYKLSFNHQMSNRIQQVQPDFFFFFCRPGTFGERVSFWNDHCLLLSSVRSTWLSPLRFQKLSTILLNQSTKQ